MEQPKLPSVKFAVRDLRRICRALEEVATQARNNDVYDAAIEALQQAAGVALTAHQIEERHAALEVHLAQSAELTTVPDPSADGSGLRGRYPVMGEDDL